MTVAKFILPASQVDHDLSVLARIGATFAPHQTDPISSAVVIDPGHVRTGNQLIETPVQTVDFELPVSEPRIDRIVVSMTTGGAYVVQGVAASNPVPPTLPDGVFPIAQVALRPDRASITNSDITDERDFTSTVSGSGTVNIQRFTADGVYTPTPGTSRIIVEMVGGGAGGGGCAAAGSGAGSAAGGGSAGAYTRSMLPVDFSEIEVTTGIGGTGGAAGGNNGSAGSASSFGTRLSAPGGKGGYGSVAYSVPAVVGGGVASDLPRDANVINAAGSAGSPGMIFSQYAVIGGNGAASYFGGTGVGGGNQPGYDGVAPGAGGGGASTITGAPARAGGAGADGIVVIYEFAA